MAAGGARVLLTGIGGDELLTSSADPSVELIDLLVQSKLWQLHERLKIWSLALRRPYPAVFWRHVITPVLPRQLQLQKKRTELSRFFAFLNPSFVEQFDLPGRMLSPTDPFGFRLPSSRGQAAALMLVTRVISCGTLLDWGPVEISYPYTHRPLVEFLQAIPATQWIRPGETRSLMRRSLRTYLPPEIIKRKSKGSPAEAMLRAVGREWSRLSRLFRDSRIVARGYVNEAALATLLAQPFVGHDLTPVSLVRFAHLECWMQALEEFSKRKHVASKPSAAALRAKVA